MSDGHVTTGHLGSLAQILQDKLGRKVRVHRVETQFRKPGGKMGKQIRYSLSIDGCHPPTFFNMTVSEVKSRMAMLSDMLYSGVIYAGLQGNVDKRGTGPHDPSVPEELDAHGTSSVAPSKITSEDEPY